MITLGIIVMFSIYDVSIISTYQKMIYYATISLAILSGIGLNFIFELFMRIPYRSIGNILSIIFLVTVFFYSFKDYYPGIPEGYLVLEKDYEVVKWLKDNNYTNRTVLGTFLTSEALYPISGNYPIANIFFKGNGTARSDMGGFFESNCTIKREIIDRYNISIIISEKNVECENFNYREIYNRDMFFIYEDDVYGPIKFTVDLTNNPAKYENSPSYKTDYILHLTSPDNKNDHNYELQEKGRQISIGIGRIFRQAKRDAEKESLSKAA